MASTPSTRRSDTSSSLTTATLCSTPRCYKTCCTRRAIARRRSPSAATSCRANWPRPSVGPTRCSRWYVIATYTTSWPIPSNSPRISATRCSRSGSRSGSPSATVARRMATTARTAASSRCLPSATAPTRRAPSVACTSSPWPSPTNGSRATSLRRASSTSVAADASTSSSRARICTASSRASYSRRDAYTSPSVNRSTARFPTPSRPDTLTRSIARWPTRSTDRSTATTTSSTTISSPTTSAAARLPMPTVTRPRHARPSKHVCNRCCKRSTAIQLS